MKCPKYVAAMLASGQGVYPIEAECDKEECAWWNKTQGECNLVTIAVELFNVSGFLNDIRDRMPPAGE